MRFSVTINDAANSKDRIEVTSTHQCPWMLPWRVQVGAKSWNTYSTALPLRIASIADKSGPCASWLDGRQYWDKGFWTDSDFWSLEVGPKFEKDTARQMSKMLPGYVDAAKLFEIDECNIGCINMQPDSLFLQLRSRQPQTISSVWWWNYLKNGKATATWSHMLQLRRKCESIAVKQPWLLEWRTAAGDHILECHIAGSKCYSESDEKLKEFILPAWQDAGMHGVPEVELMLRRGSVWCGTVYLSSSEARALVVNAKPGAGSHWFDRQEISFHPKAPVYLIVHSDGRFERRSIKPNSEVLPDWARSK